MLFEKPVKTTEELPWAASQCICGRYGWLRYDRLSHFILGIAFGIQIGILIAWVT